MRNLDPSRAELDELSRRTVRNNTMGFRAGHSSTVATGLADMAVAKRTGRRTPEQRQAQRLHENRVKLHEMTKKRGYKITREDLERWEDLAAAEPDCELAQAVFVLVEEVYGIMRQRTSRRAMEQQIANENVRLRQQRSNCGWS